MSENITKKIVVIGTDTDVGKTYFCGALIKKILEQSNNGSIENIPDTEINISASVTSNKKNVCYIKPFQSGVEYNVLHSETSLMGEEDVAATKNERRHGFRRRGLHLKKEGGEDWVVRGHDRRKGDCNYICEAALLSCDDAYSFGNFRKAASPFLAAEEIGEAVPFVEIIEKTKKCINNYNTVIIESSGGLLTPIHLEEKALMQKYMGADGKNTSNNNFFEGDALLWTDTGMQCATLASFLASLGKDINIVLVARFDLGTLNHTLLTISSLRSMGLKPISVQLNSYFRNTDDSINVGNFSFLERLLISDGIDVGVFNGKVSQELLHKLMDKNNV